MAQKTFTSTFQRNMETSWTWYASGYEPGASFVQWTTHYQSGGGPTILAQNYNINFDVSELPTSAVITNIGITFPWHNTSSYYTTDLTIKIGDMIKYLSASISGVRYRLITFDSIGTNYTKSGTTLTVPIEYFRYAGTKPSHMITTKPGEVPSPLSGSGGWFTGYNPSATSTGYADEAVYITVDYDEATQGSSNNGAGGTGGGGRGNYYGNVNSTGVAGIANTGGGGGGASYHYTNGTTTINAPGAGGSGVVIIRNTRF